ncbi:MAG: hypothetical protein AB7I18_02850 [Candidatus Berkiella sp.]
MSVLKPTTSEFQSEGHKPFYPDELSEKEWELLSAKLKSPIESYGVVNMMRQKSAVIADSLFSNEDRLLMSLAKTPALAAQNGVIALQPVFNAEAIAESFVNKKYLDQNKRKKLLVTVNEGQFFDEQGMSLWGEYIYGLLPDGRLYADKANMGKNHSHIVAGLPVIATGHAYFSNGTLITLSNNSGHYKPMPSQMKKGIQWFLDKCGTDFIFEDHSSFAVSADLKGLKYAKASALMNDTTDENVTKRLTMSELNSLFKDHFFELTEHHQAMRQMEQKENGTDSDAAPYGKAVYYTVEKPDADYATEQAKCYYITENGKEEIAFQEPVVQPEQDQLDPVYMIYTSLENKSVRFTGTKDLDMYKAKPGQ